MQKTPGILGVFPEFSVKNGREKAVRNLLSPLFVRLEARTFFCSRNADRVIRDGGTGGGKA